MKLKSFVRTAIAGVGLSLLGTACDWSGGGDATFNTSGGSVAINISGNYRGILSDGRAVSQTSGGTISSLSVQQSGNVVEVLDSNGQKYRGTVGSPLSLASPDEAGFLSTGAQLANFQVSWEGTDFVAGKDVIFSGIITVASVSDIQGDSTVQTTDSTVSDGATQNSDETAGTASDASTTTDSTSTVDTTQTVFDSNGNPITEGEVITISNTSTDATNSTTAIANTSNNTTANNNNTGRTITSTFQITGSNAQYRLKGSWIENGGVVATVDAISEAAGGVIQTVAAPAAN
jgi:hypothetical protein